jgi:DNA-binding NtrC family response regulator
VLRSIRSQWPAAEVVIITGAPTLESAKEAVRLGAFDYLAKPVEPVQVVQVAQRAAEHKWWALQKRGQDPFPVSLEKGS